MIRKVSLKRAAQLAMYYSERDNFLRGKKCPVTNEPATEIHHMKGRSGALLIDKRYWLAVSRKGHRFIEDNPKWAKDNGFSLSRL